MFLFQTLHTLAWGKVVGVGVKERQKKRGKKEEEKASSVAPIFPLTFHPNWTEIVAEEGPFRAGWHGNQWSFGAVSLLGKHLGGVQC